jgi:AcrR family transcriptional regulator
VSVDEVDPDAVPGRPPIDDTAPRGPAAVRDAALAAATDLFAQRGVRAVSVREVAQVAGVNPSLVHRYVGGKDALVEAVLDRLLDAMKVDLPAFAERADAPLPGPLAYAVATHQRIVAHLVMEGRDVRDVQAEFPVMDHIVWQIQQVHGVDAATARRRGALIYAHDLAVRLFMPVLLQAAGLGPEDADDLRAAIRNVNIRLSEID